MRTFGGGVGLTDGVREAGRAAAVFASSGLFASSDGAGDAELSVFGGGCLPALSTARCPAAADQRR